MSFDGRRRNVANVRMWNGWGSRLEAFEPHARPIEELDEFPDGWVAETRHAVQGEWGEYTWLGLDVRSLDAAIEADRDKQLEQYRIKPPAHETELAA